MASNPEDELRGLVDQLIGKECWAHTGGPATGRAFTLSLGQKIRRTEPVPNPHLPVLQREFEGEYAVFVQPCPWRIQTADAVIGTSLDRNESADDRLSQTLHMLVGGQVVAAEVVPPAWDLVLTFDNGLQLVVFPNTTPHDADYYRSDYILYSPRVSVKVWGGGAINVEPRSTDTGRST